MDINTMDFAGLANQKIVLGITGGIAAYKSAELCRLLRKAGAEVRVVMTDSAKQFITPLTMQALSGHPVHDSLWDIAAEAAMGHIELARWATLILIAPASADVMAKLAHGFANDLLTTICLATTAKIFLAPAMNQQMWQNKITQENYQRLIHLGFNILDPDSGSQACGEVGPGRMQEPENIMLQLKQLFSMKSNLAGKKIVITAGPTQEALDPVRYLTNHSSGKMGFALAESARLSGAQVILIAGPVALNCSSDILRIDVITAKQMYDETIKVTKNCDIFIASAAVADYRLEKIAKEKIKKNQDSLNLKLIKNPDILAFVSQQKKRPFCVGFAAETSDLIKHAKEKLTQKKLDMIIANQVGENHIGFLSDENAVTVITAKKQINFKKQAKTLLAQQLITFISEYYGKTHTN